MSNRISTQANNYNYISPAEALSPASRDTQVQIQLDELRYACEKLMQSLAALDDRLYPILAPIVPVDETKQIEELVIVPFADILRVITHMIKDATGRVDSILHRCEL